MTVELTQEDLRRFITVAEDGCLDGKTAAALAGPESMYLAGAAELWHTFANLQPERRHQVIVVYLWNYLQAYYAFPGEVAARFFLGQEHPTMYWISPDGQSGHRPLTEEEKIQLAQHSLTAMHEESLAHVQAYLAAEPPRPASKAKRPTPTSAALPRARKKRKRRR